jgi:hypothetical protein
MESFIVRLTILMIGILSPRGQALSDAELTRLQGIAADMVEVASDSPLYLQDDTMEDEQDDDSAPIRATALSLAAVAAHESGFKKSVQNCTICFPKNEWCNFGQSFTLYQLQSTVSFGPYTQTELCADNKKATERARFVLSLYIKYGSPLRMFDGYARGNIGASACLPARETYQIFWRMLQSEELVVVRTKQGLVARPKT